MKRVQYLLYAVLMFTVMSLSAVAHAENWVQFSKTHNPGIRIYYDTDSIRVNPKGDAVTFRLKSLNPQLAGLIQICNMEVRYAYHNFMVYEAAMLDKKVYNPSGGLVSQEGREDLGLVIKSDWDFLEEVAIYAGKHGMYPKDKILNLNQYEEVVIDYKAERSKIALFPQTVKATPKGIEFDFWTQDANEFPRSYVFHCLVQQDGTFIGLEVREYMMWYYHKSKKASETLGNLKTTPNPVYRKLYNEVLKCAH